MSSHALVVDRKAERESRQPQEHREPRQSTRRAAHPATDGAGTMPRGASALGGEPRVSLLPAEVNDFHKARAARRRLGFAVFGVLVVVVAGVAGAFVLSTTSQAQLDAARATSADLVAQESQFSDLRTVQSGIALVEAGQQVGASTEIDWKTYLQALQATLPAGVAINGVTIESASPFVDFAQSSVPLEGSRVATLSFAATSPSLPSIPDWLDGLATLEGFADAVPGSVQVQTDGTYLVNITMHINADAFSLRFAEKKK
jgi:hypothetical protein